MKDEFGKYYEATEPGRRERAYAWATAIGLQDVDGLKPSKYLRSKGYEVSNDLFKDKSFYFRNALVRANYENQRLNVVINADDDVINVVKENPLSVAEEKAAKMILRDPKTTAAELATLLKVTPRQAQRVIASLKVKAGLKRRGGRKNGEWYFAKEES